MNWRLFRKNDQDWTKFFGSSVKDSRKERLIKQCEKEDVSIYVDDQSESSKGAYAALRSVASEAELERRLNSKKALAQARNSNFISLVALAISIGSFVLALIAMRLI